MYLAIEQHCLAPDETDGERGGGEGEGESEQVGGAAKERQSFASMPQAFVKALTLVLVGWRKQERNARWSEFGNNKQAKQRLLSQADWLV